MERPPGALHCLTCGQESWLDGFTVSEFDPAKLLSAALVDQARKKSARLPRAATSGSVAARGHAEMTKSYTITAQLPVGWRDDELSKFLDMARSNVIASFVQLPAEYGKCRQIDDALLLIWSNLSNAGDWFAPLFALKSHACYRAAVGLAMAGQSPEAFMVMRGAIESALYGLYIHSNKAALEIWMKRNESDDAKKKMKSEFTVGNMWKCLGAIDAKVCESAQNLYEKPIEFGGLPNPASVAMAIKMSKNPEGAQFKLNYLSADVDAISGTMKSTAQTGLVVLLIFQYVFPKRYDEIGLSAQLQALREGL